MLKLATSVLRFRPCVSSALADAAGGGSARWHSTQSQPVASSSDAAPVSDPEWDSAQPFERIPSPTLLEFFKDFGPFGKHKNATLYELNMLFRERYGPIIRFEGTFGRKDTIISFNPEDFEKIFRSEGAWPLREAGMEAFQYYRKELRPELFKGYCGLLAEQGEDWQKMRTIVNPIMLQPKIIKLYTGHVDQVAQDFMGIIAELRDHKHELPADFNEWINRWALETLAVMVLDTRLGALNRTQTPEVSKLMILTKDVMTLFYKLDVLPSPWRKIRTPAFNRLVRAMDELYEIVTSKIDAVLKRMEQNPRTSDSDNMSILEKLLKINPGAAYIMALDSLFAGLDTTSSALTGVLYCLSHNPEKQQKLREEVRQILPNKDTPLTPENMTNMPYLRACIKESLRLYPPTTGNGRCTGKNLVLQGYRVPKGTMVGMGQLVLQRTEGQFTRPTEFLPERWQTGTEAEAARAGCPTAKEAHPFLYLPFGFGPRTCVGRRLAMLELEVVVSRIIRRYHVRWNYGELKFKPSLVHIPASDLMFEMRDVVDS